MVLVGGQAINVWANLYLPRIEALRTAGPFTSKDVDFLGDKPAVKVESCFPCAISRDSWLYV